jgi:hypothetical protein
MKSNWGTGGIVTRIIKLEMEVSGQLHAPAALPLGKEPAVSIE